MTGASDTVLRHLTTTELYLKGARKTVAKMMRLQWTQDLDIETLEARGYWTTMEEMLEVVTYHLPRYENIVKTCKTSPGQVNPSDLTFATKFVAIYLFIKVKGSRPMTYQYLTVDMVSAAKQNGGFIDQKMFKTAGRYGFDFFDLDRCKHASARWLHQCRQDVVETPMRIRASDEKRRATQQIGRRDELTSFRRNRNIHPPHSLSSNSRDSNPQSTQQYRAKDSVGRTKT